MLKLGKKYRFDITGITQDACGIGIVEGIKVFVEGVLPKETVEAEIIKIEKEFAAAKLVTLVNSLYQRVNPVCSYYGRCGGCSLQHIEYTDQLKIKRDMVCEALERVAGVNSAVINKTIGMENPIRYRNKASYRVGTNDGAIVIGFFGVRSHCVVGIDECFMQHDLSTRIKKAVLNYMTECGVCAYNPENGKGLVRHVVTRIGFDSGASMVVIVINGSSIPRQEHLINEFNLLVPELKSIYLNINRKSTNVVLGDECLLLHGKPSITDFIGDLQFDVSPLSFFQVNPIQTRVLYEKVLDYAELTGSETVIDLYSGIGTISLYLAKRALRLYGVESIEQAVFDARRNANLNKVQNVEFLAGRVEKILPELWHQGVRPDVVIVDPPRKGCSSSVLDTLVAMGPVRVVYVSCNPSTLARDVLRLQRYGYKLVEVQPVDMFPHSGHVEVVVKLCTAKCL